MAAQAQSTGVGTGIGKVRIGVAYDNSATPMVMYGTGYVGFNLEAQQVGSTWQWVSDTDTGNNGASLIYGDVGGGMRFLTIPSAGPVSNGQAITSRNLVDNYTRMTIRNDGRVMIGGQQPDQSLHADYKLAVAGKLVSQSLYVTRPTTWSDFVFAPTYRLRPLAEVADYIGCYRHLPDVPSAEQVQRAGYDVNEMNAALLRKVEELTLYMLQLNEKIAVLEVQANSTKTGK
ncbi:hypothetical protein GCM10027048_34690 [Hymenobacter coalescens]